MYSSTNVPMVGHNFLRSALHKDNFHITVLVAVIWANLLYITYRVGETADEYKTLNNRMGRCEKKLSTNIKALEASSTNIKALEAKIDTAAKVLEGEIDTIVRRSTSRISKKASNSRSLR